MKRSSFTRKTPLRSGAALKRSGPLRARSGKKKAGDSVYAEARVAALDRAGHRPECGQHPGVHPGEPCSDGLEVHHIKLRSHGGGHELSNLSVLCSKAHQWVHANPDAARKIGLYR